MERLAGCEASYVLGPLRPSIALPMPLRSLSWRVSRWVNNAQESIAFECARGMNAHLAESENPYRHPPITTPEITG